MVKKLLLITITTLVLSSCAFFGASMFSMATSEEIYWLVNSGDIRDFYILDNGDPDDEPLLFLVTEENGTVRVVVFDTSLNIRGYMEDMVDGVSTDGVGFVDHNGDYVIGQTKIGRNGSTEPGDISFVNVQNLFNNARIIPYIDEVSLTKYYLRLEYSGFLEIYNENWTMLIVGQNLPSLPSTNPMSFTIPQADNSLSDIIFAEQTGELYGFTKKQLFDHAETSIPGDEITIGLPLFTISETNLTQWVTRCSKGYFVSNYDSYFLYDETGAQIEKINYRDGYQEITTIDYACDFYYVLDRNMGIIRKERVPF